MLDRRLRVVKERTLEPIARRVGRVVPANALTAAAATAGAGAAALSWQGWSEWALVAWLTGRVIDGLDGPVARLRSESSDFGGYADIVGDHLAYALIPLAIAAHADDPETWRALGALLAVLFVNAISWSYLAAILEKRSLGADARGELTSITMPPALIEGTETIVLFSMFIAFPRVATPLFWTMAGLVAVNVVQRLAWARRQL